MAVSQRVKTQLGAPLTGGVRRLPPWWMQPLAHVVWAAFAMLHFIVMGLAKLLCLQGGPAPVQSEEDLAPTIDEETGCVTEIVSVGMLPRPLPERCYAETIRFVHSGESVFGKDSEPMIVVIPGNPGGPAMYQTFAQCLHNNTGLNVLVLGHTGHTARTRTTRTFSMYDQAEHKLMLLKHFEDIWRGKQLILVGHSIGSWIAMEMLRTLDEEHVAGVIHLFPTVHHIGTTPNAERLFPVVKYFRETATLVADMLTLLPQTVLERVVRLYFANEDPRTPSNEMVARTLTMISALSLRQALYMGYTEMAYMGDLDVDHYCKFSASMTWYFGQKDGWVTAHHAADITDHLPDSYHFHCDQGLPHGFVVHDSERVASLASTWIANIPVHSRAGRRLRVPETVTRTRNATSTSSVVVYSDEDST
eukprot:m.361874 g.361874  ORF g.361874 m.361874 type:complete len:419 (-) comp19954_c0_seq1:1546-2802(-)